VPIHLDVNTPEPEAELARLLGLGARIVVRTTASFVAFSESWTVLRDPEGNGFCLQGPDTRRDATYLGNVTFACAEPARLARFWREALGYEETPFPDDLARSMLDSGIDPAEFEAYGDAVHPEGRRPRLLFQRRQKTPAPDPPLAIGLRADDVKAEVARLAGLGATRAGEADGGVALLDPEENRFVVS
jgi:catechol 2,3-dioxygenase-like lactoylglutathione lyase family enzyme